MIRIGELDIDASVSEEHKIENEATEFPVEEGANVTDHVRPKPLELSIEGLITDTPLHADPVVQAANAAKPSATALAELERIFAEREAVPIVTSLRRYERMLPLTLTIPRSRTQTGGLFFTATFRELITVTNAKIAVRVSTVRARRKPKLGSRPNSKPPRTVERCIERDPKTGACLKSETLTLSDNGHWLHPVQGAGPGRPLTPAEDADLYNDLGGAPGHEAEFDPAQGSWVDKRTNQPVSKYPDRAYWDETGKPVQYDKPSKDKVNPALTPTDGVSNGFWDSLEQHR